MADANRTFTGAPAVRERVPLLFGLSGPSGSGKTLSALRLATGIIRVTGGEIRAIDTEGRRMLHYAPKRGEKADPLNPDMAKRTWDFYHVPFSAPYPPKDYEAAIRHCAERPDNGGPGVVIVDSMTHEHDSIGGVLWMHDDYIEKHGNDKKHTWTAWKEPKRQRQHLIDAYTGLGLNIIFCFRAKEKLHLVKGDEPVSLGWMPVAGEEHLFEMTLSMVFYPGSRGVPQWNTDAPGERLMYKRYESLVSMFPKDAPIDEQLGENLARWAAGDAVEAPSDEEHSVALDKIAGAGSEAEIRTLAESFKKQSWTTKQRGEIGKALNARNKELRA